MLNERIEELRGILYKEIEKGEVLNELVLILSQELDILINNYYQTSSLGHVS